MERTNQSVREPVGWCEMNETCDRCGPAVRAAYRVQKLTWRGFWPSARARVSHPAFGGVFEISASGAHLQAAWTNGDQAARLISRLDSGQGLVQWTTRTGDRQAALTDLAHHQFAIT